MTKKKPSPDAAEVGRRLAQAREKIDLTQIKLAKLAGVRQEALSKFECGKRGLETHGVLAVLRAAAEAGVNVDFVLRGVGGETRTAPLVVAQDPTVRLALIELGRQLAEQESEPDSPLSETKVASDKRDKPSPASR